MDIVERGEILYKKCYIDDDVNNLDECIVILLVTEPGVCGKYHCNPANEPDTPSVFYTNENLDKKCRVREARVVAIQDLKTKEFLDKAFSYGGGYRFIYNVGATVKPFYGFEEGDFACGGGIHGFRDRESAEAYEL